METHTQKTNLASRNKKKRFKTLHVTKATYFMPKKQSMQLRMKFQKKNIEQRTPQTELLKH